MQADVVPLNAWRGRLQIGSKGEKKTLYNLMMYLRNLPTLGKAIRLNEMTGNTEWRGTPICDTDYVDIQIVIEQAGFQPNKNDIPTAVARLGIDNGYHPVRDYLDSLKWDGVTRLDRFLPILFGTPDTEYEQMIGPKWMIGAVARIYEPGCKMDNMLVLEGPQNLGKSTALRVLFGADNFTEMVNELRDHKRFVEQIQGKWVVEFAELSSIRRADVDLVKAIITMQTDKVRPSYGRHTVETPRQCVLAASVNPKSDTGYLSDPTGNRRYWPVTCTQIDMEKLTRKRDQLWAEAVERYRDKERWWLNEHDSVLAGAEQVERVSIDPWQDHIAETIVRGQEYTSIHILSNVIKLPLDRQDGFTKTRIATIMSALGWNQKVAKYNQPDGSRKSVRVWVYPS